jgi:uncharacterized membrane protein YqiK
VISRVEALGAQSYAAVQMMRIVGEQNVCIVPDVAVNGGGAGAALIDALLGSTLRDRFGAVSAVVETPPQA